MNTIRMDTPTLFRQLAYDMEASFAIDVNSITRRSLFYSFMNTIRAKITHYQDIAPYADMLNKLHNRKIRKASNWRQLVGFAEAC